jgi:hypothetical protein
MILRNAREAVRFAHLVIAAILAVCLYTPWGEDPATIWLVRVAIIPTMTLTGLWLWQYGRLRHRLRRWRKSVAAKATGGATS